MASTGETSFDRVNKRIKTENGEQVEAMDESRSDSGFNPNENGPNLNETSEASSPSNQLILLLAWSSRDNVILSLNKFSSALYSKGCPVDKRKDLIREIQTQIRRLMTLPVQTKGNKFKYMIDLTEDDEIGKQAPGPKLKLQWALRQTICDTLFENHHAIMYFDDASEPTKKALIDANINLVQKLMSLEVAEEIDLTPKIKQEQPEPSQANGSLMNGLGDLDKKLNAMKEQLKEFVVKSINARPETCFTFKIDKMAQFLRIDGEKRFSDRFYVRNIPFFCVIQNKLAKKEDFNAKQQQPFVPAHLEVFLHCDHDSKDRTFSCFVKVDLALSTNASDGKELRQNFEFDYTRRMGCGVQSFVSHSELNNTKNGYIQNDCIYVRIYLVADKPTGV